MLQKLRSRHPVDLPSGAWGRKKGILAVLGGIAFLFLLVPLLLALVGGLLDGRRVDREAALAIAAMAGFLLLVLIVAGIRGKPGWDR